MKDRDKMFYFATGIMLPQWYGWKQKKYWRVRAEDMQPQNLSPTIYAAACQTQQMTPKCVIAGLVNSFAMM